MSLPVEKSTLTESPPRRRFPLWLDVAFCLSVIGLGFIVAGAFDLFVWHQSVGVTGVLIQGVMFTLAVAFSLGVLSAPLVFLLSSDSRVQMYIDRMVDDGRPPIVGHVFVWGAGLAMRGGMLAFALAISAALGIFWIVPTLVWLSFFHGVSPLDAASYALTLQAGRPEYDGPLGINTDPATIGFFVFTLVGWAIILGVLALAAAPLYLLWRRREARALDRWLEEERTPTDRPPSIGI
jgi:hypothetical protein